MGKILSWLKKEDTLSFIDTILFSYSQILFAKNRFIGIIVLLSTFVHPKIGVNALLSCIFANSFAFRLGINKLEIRAGLYGFNAVLLGMSMSLYIGIEGLHAVVYILLFCSILTVITGTFSFYLKKLSLPYMSIPFVIVTWLAILIEDKVVLTNPYVIFKYPNIETFLKNIGYIIFSPDSASGIMVLLALFLYSRLMCIVVVISYLACIGFASIFPTYSLFMTTSGFNAILTSIAIAGVFYVLNFKSLFIGITASVFTVILGSALSSIFLNSGLPVLTIPFNLVTLLTLYMMDRTAGANALSRVHLPESPEKNVHLSIMEKEGGSINLLTDRRLSLPFMGWWHISQGVDGRHTHKGIFRYGIDFIVIGRDGKAFKNMGETRDEHYCYDMPVTAPQDGIVTAMVSSVTDNPVAATNLQYNWGNYVIIQHAPDFFSVLAHLRQKGIIVNVGQVVKKGQTVGYVGSSGLAPYPHLHVQFQSAVSMWSQTLPPKFSDFLIRHKDHDEYVALGIPNEEQGVMNLPADSSVKETIGFEIGQRLRYEVNFNNKTFYEDWNFDMDSYGVLFIESSIHKDRLYFINGDTSISFIRYSGDRESGLFILSLGIDKIPFYADDRLRFQRQTPYLGIRRGISAHLFDIILPFYKGRQFSITYTFKAGLDGYLLFSKINGGAILERQIVFDRGVKEITFKSRHINCRVKRLD